MCVVCSVCYVLCGVCCVVCGVWRVACSVWRVVRDNMCEACGDVVVYGGMHRVGVLVVCGGVRWWV